MHDTPVPTLETLVKRHAPPTDRRHMPIIRHAASERAA